MSKNYEKPENFRLENSKKDQVGEIDQYLNKIESKNRKAKNPVRNDNKKMIRWPGLLAWFLSSFKYIFVLWPLMLGMAANFAVLHKEKRAKN